MELMSASLKAEQHIGAESLDGHNKLKIALDHTNRNNREVQKSTEHSQRQVCKAKFSCEGNSCMPCRVSEKTSLAMYRVNALVSMMERVRSLLDSFDYGKDTT